MTDMYTHKESWRGRIALVTGATAGIGCALVDSLIEAGMFVYGCGRRVDRLQELVQKYPSAFRAVQCDVSCQADVERMFSTIKLEHGKVHLLINNAGLGTVDTLIDGDPSGWQQMLNVNVMGVALCAKYAVALMRQNAEEPGHIINLCSMSGHRVSSLAFYSATKYAVRALTEGFRRELREKHLYHIRIGEISPGVVETEFHEQCFGSDHRTYQEHPTMLAEDMVQTVWYMLTAPMRMEVNDVLIRPTRQLV